VADAGYDSEANHCLLRGELGVQSIIPPEHSRPAKDGRLPVGRCRRPMKQRFAGKTYRRRWQVETVMSMLKRKPDGCIRARSRWFAAPETAFERACHNVMILYALRRCSTEPEYRS
jgi:hypothetical protein